MAPIPKRREAMLGRPHAKREVLERNAVERAASSGKPKIPKPNPEWHGIALGWYRSLALSGQSRWYEATDWAMAYLAADLLDSQLQDGYRPGLLAEFNDISARLLCAEGDRRRMRIELIRAGGDDDEEAAASAVAEWDGKLRPVLVLTIQTGSVIRAAAVPWRQVPAGRPSSPFAPGSRRVP